MALLAMPLAQAIAHPTRLSVLSSLQIDAEVYDRIAVDLANRRALDSIPPLQPPGFVTFLAVVYAVAGHNWVAGKVALWMVLVAITAGAGLLARRVYGSEIAGWMAALLCAGSPALRAYTGTLQYELLAAAMLLLLVGLARRPAEGSRPSRAVAAGLALGAAAGIAVLTREVLLPVVPLVAVCAARTWRERLGKRAALAGALVAVSTAAVAIGLWTWTQSHRAGRVVAISDKGPAVMAFGNNPRANGTFNVGLAGVAEPYGWAFIRAQPAQAMRLSVRKALYFWGVLRDGWNVPRPSATWFARATLGQVPLERILPIARGGWILAALVVSLALWKRQDWRGWWILPAAIAAVMAVHLVTVSSHRFAVPVLPLCFVIVAGPLAALAAAITRSRLLLWTAAVIVTWLLICQLFELPVTYRLPAADLDGVAADNVLDHQVGGFVRAVDAARGPRPALLLSDEHLPKGRFTLRLLAGARAAAPAGQPVARISIVAADGESACERFVLPGELPAGGLEPVDVACRLTRDGPSTLLVETLGRVDLVFESVHLAWEPEHRTY
jgi:hypothetical protein